MLAPTPCIAKGTTGSCGTGQETRDTAGAESSPGGAQAVGKRCNTHMKKSLPSPKIIVCCTHLSIQLHCHNIVERDLQGVFVHVSFQFQIHFFDPMSLSTPACSKPDCNYSHCCNFSLCLRAYMKFGSWCNLKKPTVTYSHIRFWRMCNFQFYISILASNLLPTQC